MAAMRRIQKELSDITSRPIEGISVDPVEEDIYTWKCSIKAAVGLSSAYRLLGSQYVALINHAQSDSPYKNGTFHFTVNLPKDFPFKAPSVTFTTKIYHPGINEEGHICVPVLREEWKPTITLSTVLAIIQEKVNNPSPDDPFEPEIAALLKNDKAKFLANAKEQTKKHAM